MTVHSLTLTAKMARQTGTKHANYGKLATNRQGYSGVKLQTCLNSHRKEGKPTATLNTLKDMIDGVAGT